jgi:hypothetical protein
LGRRSPDFSAIEQMHDQVATTVVQPRVNDHGDLIMN